MAQIWAFPSTTALLGSLSHRGAQRLRLAAPTSCADDRRFDRCCGGALRTAGGAASAVFLRLVWHPAAHVVIAGSCRSGQSTPLRARWLSASVNASAYARCIGSRAHVWSCRHQSVARSVD